MTQEKPTLNSSQRLLDDMPWLGYDVYVAMIEELKELLLKK